MKHGKTAVFYYITILCLAIFFTTIFIYSANVNILFHFTSGAFVLISLILVLNNRLPEVWYTGIIFGLIIIVLHVTIQLWPLTLLMIGATVLFLFVYYKFKAETLSKFILAGIAVLFLVNILFIDHQNPPNIMDEDIQASIQEMKDYDDIKDVSIGLENEDTIYCALRVIDSVTDEEKKSLGETCAKTLSTKVGERNNLREPNGEDLGELYDNYILEISVSTDDEEHVLFERKYTNTKDLAW